MVMCLLTSRLFNHPLPFSYLLFAFCGTLCSYSFHWFLTGNGADTSGRAGWSVQNKILILSIFLMGIAGAAYSFFLLPQIRLWLIVSAVLTFLYSAPMLPFRPFQALKRIAVGKTSFLAFVWTQITVILPLMLIEPNWSSDHYLFIFNRYFFIFSICILFDHRDRVRDRQDGIRSMVTQLSEKGVDVLFWCTQLIILLSTGLMLPYFFWLDLAIILLPTILLSIVYRTCKRSTSDLVYYFLLDGLMMLSGLILLLLSILTKFDG